MSTLHLLLPAKSRFDALPDTQRLWHKAQELKSGHESEMAVLDYMSASERVPIGALWRNYLYHDAGKDGWMCADLAHVKPDINGVRMLAYGNFGLDTEQIDTLLASLNQVLEEDAMELVASTPSRWHLRIKAPRELPILTPTCDVLGDDLTEYFPRGQAGRYWRQLMNEMQILLHQSEVNKRLAEQGLPTVNCLWLWGAGTLPQAELTSSVDKVYTDASLIKALFTPQDVDIQPVNDFSFNHAVTVDTLLDLSVGVPGEKCLEIIRSLYQKRLAKRMQLHFADGQRHSLSIPPRWQRWRAL